MAITWSIHDFVFFGVTYLNNPLAATQCPVPASVQRGVVFVHHSRVLQHWKYDKALTTFNRDTTLIVNIRSVKRHDRASFVKQKNYVIRCCISIQKTLNLIEEPCEIINKIL